MKIIHLELKEFIRIRNANKWHAQIRFKNKNMYLGLFDNLEDAKNARQKKRMGFLVNIRILVK